MQELQSYRHRIKVCAKHTVFNVLLISLGLIPRLRSSLAYSSTVFVFVTSLKFSWLGEE